MEYGDPDSSSGGCSMTRLSACPVSTNAHVVHFCHSARFNLLKTLTAHLHLWIAGYLARPSVVGSGESRRECCLLPPGSLPSSNQYLQF